MTYDDAGNELKSPAGDPSDGVPAAAYSPRNLLQSQLIREYDRCFEELGRACIQADPVQVWLLNVFDGRGVRVTSTESIVASTININDPEPPTRVYFYTPELAMLNIAARTTGRTADVIWFGSRPIADHDGSTVRYTFTDHLGTPILQTSASAAIVWRANMSRSETCIRYGPARPRTTSRCVFLDNRWRTARLSAKRTTTSFGGTGVGGEGIRRQIRSR